jgi:hypothetical protein
MIRSGKSAESSWLLYSHLQYGAWAKLNGISFNGVHIASASGNDDEKSSDDKGAGIFATETLTVSLPFLTTPEALVLSKSRVHEMASGDAKLAELFDVCKDFVTVSVMSMVMTMPAK